MRIKSFIIIGIVLCCNLIIVHAVKSYDNAIQRVSFKLVGKEPVNKYEAQVENYLLSLVYPITRFNPDVWESPLIITDKTSGNSYQTENLLITDVYYVQKSNMIIVESYSGSMSYIHFFNIKNAKEKYKTFKVYTEKIIIMDNQIVIYPGCECGVNNNEDLCSCSSAKIYNFDNNFQPIYDSLKSRELTKKSIGVEFEGEKNILFPKTSNAEIMNEYSDQFLDKMKIDSSDKNLLLSIKQALLHHDADWKLRILRNEFYARRGRVFKSKELSNHFSQFAWYKPNQTVIDISLPEVERKKVKIIQIYERELEKLLPHEKVLSKEVINTYQSYKKLGFIDRKQELIDVTGNGRKERLIRTLYIENNNTKASFYIIVDGIMYEQKTDQGVWFGFETQDNVFLVEYEPYLTFHNALKECEFKVSLPSSVICDNDYCYSFWKYHLDKKNLSEELKTITVFNNYLKNYKGKIITPVTHGLMSERTVIWYSPIREFIYFYGS